MIKVNYFFFVLLNVWMILFNKWLSFLILFCDKEEVEVILLDVLFNFGLIVLFLLVKWINILCWLILECLCLIKFICFICFNNGDIVLVLSVNLVMIFLMFIGDLFYKIVKIRNCGYVRLYFLKILLE